MSTDAVFPQSGPRTTRFHILPAAPAKQLIGEVRSAPSFHRLSKHMEAIGNYVTAARRLCEVGHPAAFASQAGEILHRALVHVHEAGRTIEKLRAAARDDGGPPAPLSRNKRPGRAYRIHFLNEFAHANLVIRACQRTITIRSARSAERAVQAAKKRFARMEHIPDWHLHAQFIEVEVIGAEIGSL